MIIENTSDTDISAWQLSFDGNVTINDLWNGKLIENSNGSFKVKNSENNSVIAAGSSVSFNFGGTKNIETEPNLGYSEPVETLPPVLVVTDEFSDAETAAESTETDTANSETDPAETEIPSETVLPEITTVTEPVVMPVSEVVFSNYRLTGMVIPMEFDFEIDPEVDSDNDGLPDYLEKELGTDRYNADTDGDGLPDGYEYFTLGTDPKKADSDDNGISDADEDFDEDGLTNLEEYELGTDPFSKDTDHDGLSDYDEVKIHNTDPLKYDTDGDKVSDGDEIILGLDPNNPATFGYPDNEYTTVQTVGEDSSALDYINNIEDNPYSVTIEITAAGVADNNLTAGESGYSYSILQNDAVLGVVPEFDYSDGLSVTDVVIKFKIDDSAVDNKLGVYADEPEFNGINRLQVFKYFEDNNILLPIETFYDEETKTVYTHVDELGTYCLMDMEMWINYLENLEPGNYYAEDDEVNSANIAFCLDTRYIADESSFDSVKSDMKAIAEDAFDRYTDVKIYVYYQELGMSLRAKDNLLMDKDGNNYFTSYDEAEAAIDGMTMPKKSVAYDLVHASNYMIDLCDRSCKAEKLDKNIITMYHITNDDNIVGSVDDAKHLIRTVEDSLYTDENDEQAYRINVSVICPNGKVKDNSYVRKLVDASRGIFYSGNTQEVQVQAQVMTLNVAANNNEQEMTTADTIKKNVVEICGEGYGSDYRVISSIGNDVITLDTPLRENKYYTSKSKKPTDTDGDGIWDWDEVCIEALEELRQDKISDGVIYAKDMPSLLEVMTYYNKHGKGYVGKGFEKYMNENNSNPYSALVSLKILPLNSNPADIDSDGDGFFDGITGKYEPTGYYKVADKWPLSSKPHLAFYQKDGEYYFNSFSFPDTNVGGRFYGAKGLNLEEDDQKYIYTLCEVANKNLKKDVIDPLLIMSICAHETGSQADAINKNSKTTGYMQLFPFYVIDYCESDLIDGEPYYTIYGFYEYVKLITPKEKWNEITENSYKHYNNYRSNGEIGIVTKAIINYAINNGVIKEHQYDILKHYQSSLDDVQKVLTDEKINITFGIAFLSAFNTYKTTDYDALKSYCGDSKSPREDIFYRNTLATLIEEDVIYEKEYVNEANYYININGVFVKLSKS